MIRTNNTNNKNDSLFVASIEKGTKVLDAFYQSSQYLRLADIVRITGFSKGAAQRYVRTWEILGFLKKDPQTKQYSLTARMLDFAYSFLHSSPLIEVAIPHLVDLRNRCGETVNLSFRDGLELIYVFRTPSQRHTLNGSIIGRRLQLYNTSGGRAMLSTLSDDTLLETIAMIDCKKVTPYTETDPNIIYNAVIRARQDGYALVDEETILGEITMAAPVVNRHFDGVAAVHIPVMKKDWTVEDARRELAPELLSVARSLSVY